MAINMDNQTYVHWTSTWTSATWWGVRDFAQFLPVGRTLTALFTVKDLDHFFSPTSYIKEKKERILQNQQKRSGFWCKDGFCHPDLTHSSTSEDKEALVCGESEAYSFTSAQQMDT